MSLVVGTFEHSQDTDYFRTTGWDDGLEPRQIAYLIRAGPSLSVPELSVACHYDLLKSLAERYRSYIG